MTDHDRTTVSDPAELPVLEAQKTCRPQSPPALVVDLSGFHELGVTDLSLLLTAQQVAQEEDRDVWLAGVPFHIWQKLHELGLGRFFRPFPSSDRLAV